MFNILLAIASLASVAFTSVALACPDCPAGQAARQQFLGEGLGIRLLIAVIPFVAVGLVSFGAEQIGRR